MFKRNTFGTLKKKFKGTLKKIIKGILYNLKNLNKFYTNF